MFLKKWKKSTKDRKNELRQRALERRDAIPRVEREAYSQALVTYTDKLFPEKETISAFWPIYSEIDPRPLISAIGLRGNRIAFPAIVDKGKMVFRLLEWNNGLNMPSYLQTQNAKSKIVDPTTILLPLVAFDNQGTRIGYGAGYYDRIVAEMRERGHNPRLIALAFDCQQIESIPAESHDISLQSILTENGFKKFH